MPSLLAFIGITWVVGTVLIFLSWLFRFPDNNWLWGPPKTDFANNRDVCELVFFSLLWPPSILLAILNWALIVTGDVAEKHKLVPKWIISVHNRRVNAIIERRNNAKKA